MKIFHKAFLTGATLATITILSNTVVHAQSAEYIIFDVKGSAEGLAEKFVLGSVLKDGDKIDLPADAEIRLLDKAGEVIVLTGPMVGTVEEEEGATQQAKEGSSALKIISKLMFGEKNLVNNLGAARAISSPDSNANKTQPWVPVISKPGTYCLPFEAPVFGRAVATKKAKVTIISGGGVFKEKIWEKEEKSISLVDLISPEKESYTMFFSAHTAESTIHLLDRSQKNVAAQIAWMAERGCKTQAVQLLKQASDTAG